MPCFISPHGFIITKGHPDLSALIIHFVVFHRTRDKWICKEKMELDFSPPFDNLVGTPKLSPERFSSLWLDYCLCYNLISLACINIKKKKDMTIRIDHGQSLWIWRKRGERVSVHSKCVLDGVKCLWVILVVNFVVSKLYLTHNHFGHLNVVVLFKISVCDFSMLSALDTISHYWACAA